MRRTHYRLYATYLDPALHAAVTGAPVTASAESGAPFRAFDGQIAGTMLSGMPIPIRL
jgi:hypothetical protein